MEIKKISIIIPIYNEIKTITKLLKKVKETELNLKKEIIVVDDKSNDGSRELIKNISWVNKYFHNKTKGKGAAVRTGIKHSTGEIILIQDADLEYNPEDYSKIIEPILTGDSIVVYGSRFLNQSSIKKDIFHYGNRFLSFLTSMLYRQKITDVETCYKAFHKKVLKKIKIDSNGFEIEPEITVKLIKAGFKIREVPIRYSPRERKEKKIKIRDGFKAAWVIIKYKF